MEKPELTLVMSNYLFLILFFKDRISHHALSFFFFLLVFASFYIAPNTVS